MILLSACLAGFNVRYNGTNAQNDLAKWLLINGQAITMCPEILAGFGIPRQSAEINGGSAAEVFAKKAHVLEKEGNDVTAQFVYGVSMAMKIVSQNDICAAFLKDNSPTCGVDKVYDGSFSGKKKSGMGLFTQSLRARGISVFSEQQLQVEKVKPFIVPDLVMALEHKFS
ncbi:DUF523 domain-containing protein [Liquorilactobacillus oeni]|uniref:Uncharacterized protein n=1 Tax=Liquorilactobacillus oeni DSM 19972 TaxID=1423777 RepID=A0A0R1MKR9_9LACO|nr:DUF523 domain-containing protein [Liquorilactobacillus oeni]KRL05115.1 hypothetical protein FD46_GL001060 [Liquorilactobacillus oeni DSM 19972]